VEAAEKIAEQETFRRSVAAHMSGQQGTSSAYMMRPDTYTPADSTHLWLSLHGNVRRLSRNTSIARVNPDEVAGLERSAFRKTERGVRWCRRWKQEWR
jgi:hypothetical protein